MEYRQLVSAVALLAMAGCVANQNKSAAVSPMSSEAACVAQRGEWVPFRDLYPGKQLNEPDSRRYICLTRAEDAGNTCTDGSQCKVNCLAPAGAISGAAAVGQCSDHNWGREDELKITDGVVSYPSISLERFPAKVAMLADFKANRDLWRSKKVDDYKLTLEQSCYCLYGPYYGPNRITVRNGKTASVIYQGERRDGFRYGDELIKEKALKDTIEGVFDRLERTLSNATRNASIKVEYDSVYGFPTLIDFDRPDQDHEEYRLILTKFRPI